jgi:hypothetical protein
MRTSRTSRAVRWNTLTHFFLTLLFVSITIGGSAQRDSRDGASKKRTSPVITTLAAKPERDYVRVIWTTQNQCIDGTYLVERSTDGETFEIIGLRRGINIGEAGGMEFFFIDNEPPAESNVYYRIRHFGNDNSELLSKAVIKGNS